MRKIFIVLLMVGFVFLSTNAHAVLNRFNQDQEVKMWTVTYARNGTTQAASGQQTTLCPITKISAGTHRVLGFSITPINSRGEGFVGIYDADSMADIDLTLGAGANPNALECEAELGSFTGQGNYVEIWFPYPYEVQEGIAVMQGSNTAVTIFYEDYRR